MPVFKLSETEFNDLSCSGTSPNPRPDRVWPHKQAGMPEPVTPLVLDNSARRFAVVTLLEGSLRYYPLMLARVERDYPVMYSGITRGGGFLAEFDFYTASGENPSLVRYNRDKLDSESHTLKQYDEPIAKWNRLQLCVAGLLIDRAPSSSAEVTRRFIPFFRRDPRGIFAGLAAPDAPGFSAE